MIYQIVINELLWDKINWRKYCKYAKRKCGFLTFPDVGIVELRGGYEGMSEHEANIIVKGILSEYLDDKFPIERYLPVNRESRLLPIETDVIADTYLFLSIKLAILQADEECAAALDQYFLDIKANYSANYWHFYDFEEELMTMLDIKGIDYKEIESNAICTLIKETINQGTYITVHLDEYYISRKESYDARHLVRENLIYGYDDENRVFNVFGFGKREQTEAFSVSYDEMVLAFEKGRLFYFSGAEYLKMDSCYPVTLVNIACKETFRLTGTFFISKLKAFLNPRENRVTTDDIQVYGSNVYQWILEELEGKTDRETVDYKTFHLLYEHKKNVHRCIQKLKESNEISFHEDIAQSYAEVVKSFNRVRIMYMREAGMREGLIKTKKLYKILGDNGRLVQELRKAIRTEAQVLERIIYKNYQ